MSVRETVMAAAFARLATIAGAAVRRNAALPETVPAGGLVVLRDGDPGAPDVTLNPRSEYYTHRAEIEAFAAAEAAVDVLFQAAAAALAADRTLGGLAEYMALGAPELGAVEIDGAAPIVAARANLTIEYLVTDPLAA
ncbi:MAG: acyl-CoA transferase [Rhodospirillales bacterium]